MRVLSTGAAMVIICTIAGAPHEITIFPVVITVAVTVKAVFAFRLVPYDDIVLTILIVPVNAHICEYCAANSKQADQKSEK